MKAFHTCDVDWGATVGDNVLWKAIMPEDLLQQCLSDLGSGREIRERDKMSGFWGICLQPPK
jgi:hypothetical protein